MTRSFRIMYLMKGPHHRASEGRPLRIDEERPRERLVRPGLDARDARRYTPTPIVDAQELETALFSV